MSEEEKKAIDYLKNDVVYWLDKGKDFVVIDIGENDKLHSILNLIEKQKKQIERLKYDREMLYGVIDELKENQVLIDDIEAHRIVYIDTPEFEEKYISKDKIREKKNLYYKKLQENPQNEKDIQKYAFGILALKELLEEN